MYNENPITNLFQGNEKVRFEFIEIELCCEGCSGECKADSGKSSCEDPILIPVSNRDDGGLAVQTVGIDDRDTYTSEILQRQNWIEHLSLSN